MFGQDGISAAPVHSHDVDEFTRFLAGLDGEIDRDRWTWTGFGEYLTAVVAARPPAPPGWWGTPPCAAS